MPGFSLKFLKRWFLIINFILGFIKETTIREDRKSWALTSLIGVWVVIEIIALIIVAGAAGLDAYDKNSSYPKNGINSSWDW